MKICPSCSSAVVAYKSGYCKPCNNARSNAWYANNKGAKKRSALKHYYKKKYGLDIDSLPDLLAAQEGNCRICGTCIHLKGTLDATQAVVDHDHETGEVRGLLCQLCNVGLGSFRDNSVYLANAIKYLTGELK